jgi:23S rRNA pseudouridine1911/1915/1917 synthase
MQKVFVEASAIDLRLDAFLSKQFPLHSRTYFQDLIAKKFVLVNGSLVKKRGKLKAGDEVVVYFQLPPETEVRAENIGLDILFEDDHIIAINKPPGMVVHPAPGHYSNTFVNGLLYHCKGLPFGETLRPGIVHRLDKNTSGVLLAAKNTYAHQKLVTMFSQRELKKKYLAICFGSPGDVVIELGIKRHPIRRKEMTVALDGKLAITKCRAIAWDGELSLVEIDLFTGRTHQIRVHLKHHKTPILGDSVYGSLAVNKKYNACRQMLHAYCLEFCHPFTNSIIELKAPIPSDFARFYTEEEGFKPQSWY